jgi:hypothetical protein
MKTKNLFITFSLILSSLIQSQTLDWAPVGAKWYYSVCLGNSISYVVFRVEMDTVFNTLNCKKIIIDEQLSPYINIPKESLPYADDNHPFSLTRISSDSIYFFNWQCNRWEFSASNNFNFSDSISFINAPFWSSQSCNYKVKTQIQKIDTIYWGNLLLRQFHFLINNYYFLYDNIYIENIGWKNQGLNIIGYFIVDAFSVGDLRCYYHPTYGWLQYNTSIPCTYTLASVGMLSNDNNSFYYYDNKLYFNVEKNLFPLDLKIINTTGNVIYEDEINNSIYTLHNEFSEGIYLILIKDKNNNFYRKKFVKFVH